MSNRYQAWKPVVDLIQKIHEESASRSPLRSFDFFAYSYQSGIFHQPSITREFERLRALTSNPRYDFIVLIGHSQGGILAKLFVLDELIVHQRGRDLKIELVLTLDTPHYGPQPWIYPIVAIGALWSLIPFASRFPLLRQNSEMGWLSKNLRFLRNNWNDTHIAAEPCPPQPSHRHIRSFTLSGSRIPFPLVKCVVSDRSAHGFPIDRPIFNRKRKPSWSLGHGIESLRIYRHQIEEILLNSDSVAIRSVENKTDSELTTLIQAALEPGQQHEALYWLRRFREGFCARPLRGLDPAGTVQKFIALRRPHP